MDSWNSELDTGHVIWITGLSGSGKTTLAQEVCKQLKLLKIRPLLLDGDEMRGALHDLLPRSEQYSTESRRALAMSYSQLSQLFALQGHTVVVATVSLFHSVHIWNRQNLPNYIEVLLDSSLEVLQRRESKKLYSTRFGQNLGPVMGRDIQGEFPLTPNLRYVDHKVEQLGNIASEIIDFLNLSTGRHVGDS